MFPNYNIFAFSVLLLQSLPNCYGIKVCVFYILHNFVFEFYFPAEKYEIESSMQSKMITCVT
jgi:hypothetical protein